VADPEGWGMSGRIPSTGISNFLPVKNRQSLAYLIPNCSTRSDFTENAQKAFAGELTAPTDPLAGFMGAALQQGRT